MQTSWRSISSVNVIERDMDHEFLKLKRDLVAFVLRHAMSPY